MRKITITLTVGMLVLLGAACGDDDGGGGGGGDLSSAEQEYVDAAMETFDPEEAEPLTEDEARCMVTSMVDAVGVDTLEDAGLTPESFGEADSPFPEGLTEDQAEGVVDGMEDCFDLSQLFLDGMAEDASLSDEDRECLADAFDGDTVHDLFVTMLSQGEEALQEDPEAMSAILELFSQCPGALGG